MFTKVFANVPESLHSDVETVSLGCHRGQGPFLWNHPQAAADCGDLTLAVPFKQAEGQRKQSKRIRLLRKAHKKESGLLTVG